MSRKIKRTPQAALSIKGAFDEFVVAQTAKGFSESTIKNYHSHFHSISKHFDIEKPFGELTQADIDGMIVSMRESGLATNSISSYLRVFTTFIQLHRLLVDQRCHAVFHLAHPSVQIGLDGGRKEQSGVVGAEIVQVEIDGPLNESGDAAASILLISSLQACLFLRGEIEGKFFFLTQNELLSGA